MDIEFADYVALVYQDELKALKDRYVKFGAKIAFFSIVGIVIGTGAHLFNARGDQDGQIPALAVGFTTLMLLPCAILLATNIVKYFAVAKFRANLPKTIKELPEDKYNQLHELYVQRSASAQKKLDKGAAALERVLSSLLMAHESLTDLLSYPLPVDEDSEFLRRHLIRQFCETNYGLRDMEVLEEWIGAGISIIECRKALEIIEAWRRGL